MTAYSENSMKLISTLQAKRGALECSAVAFTLSVFITFPLICN
jgi:hypothetical protein